MKNLFPHTSSRGPRSVGLTALAVAAAAAIAGGVLAGGGECRAAAAGKASLHKKNEQFKAPTLEKGLLTVEGTNAD